MSMADRYAGWLERKAASKFENSSTERAAAIEAATTLRKQDAEIKRLRGAMETALAAMEKSEAPFYEGIKALKEAIA